MKIVILSEGEDVRLGYRRFAFSDSQPHIILDRAVKNALIQITISLTSLDELFDLLLVQDVLQRSGNTIHLDVRYLLGARMDRPIDDCQPFTLEVVADLLSGFAHVTILDPHSQVAVDLLNADGLYPFEEVRSLLGEFNPSDMAIVIPDAGAVDRVRAVTSGTGFDHFVQCSKEREEQTGKLSGFSIADPSLVREKCLIIDDICDGGGTFIGLAEKLREAGAKWIGLFVTHGIFSKGRELAGIDAVYSTESFPPKRDPAPTFAECEAIGGHCWEDGDRVLQTQPPQHRQHCKHCGAIRWGREQEIMKWSDPIPRDAERSER